MMILNIDFSKAFDSVSHLFSCNFFTWMGFPPYCIKMLKSCIQGKSAFISNIEGNKELFSIQRGFPQGDRPSGICFGIIVNLAFFRILNHPLIRDVTIPLPPGEEGPENLLTNRLAAFADDASAKLLAIIENLEILKKIFSEFQLTCGLKTNFDKTAVIPFNTEPEFEDLIPQYGFKKEKSFTTLGIKYTTNYKDYQKNNEKKVHDKIKKIVEFWSKFYLTVMGKVTVCKTFIYSQLAYFCPILNFSESFVRNIENLISNFVNLHLNVGKNKIFEKIEEGGLGLFRVKDYEKAIKTSFFRKSVKNPDTWAAVINNCKDSIIENDYIEDDILERFFPASQELLNTFKEFHTNLHNYPGNEGATPIFNCNEIRTQGSKLGCDMVANENRMIYTRLLNAKIDEICGDEDGNIIPLTEFRTKYGQNINLGTYNIIKNATIFRRKKCAISSSQKMPSIGSFLKSKKKGSQPFRKVFESKNARNKSVAVPTRTRERMFGFTHSPEVESKLLSLWNQNFLDNGLRTFMFKIAANRIKLNIHIAKFEQEQSEFCQECNFNGINVRETFQHFYFNCPTNIEFFDRFNRVKKIHFESDPSIVLITNQENKATKFEKTIGAILIFIVFKYRNVRNNRAFLMNKSWTKIISFASRASNFFSIQIDRYINNEIDPF